MVLVSGCFNVLHAGHIDLLEFATQYGGVHVGINGNAYIREKYKDGGVPVEQRIRVLEACRYVERVWVFDEPTPSELILKLRPAYFVRGPDYANKALAEQWALDEVGAELVIFLGGKINSSTRLISSPENSCSFSEYGIEFLR
jgi:cytidyltransferase-like protein